MKSRLGFLMLFLVALPLVVGSFASGQQSQTVSMVNLAYMTVQLSYPSVIRPSQSAAVSVQAISKDNFILDELKLQSQPKTILDKLQPRL
jgi:hypothetical protein